MSKLQDQAGLDDKTAKKKLSQYAYNKLWLVEYKTSSCLQFTVHDNVTIVWPNGKPQTCDGHVLINGCNRCTCQRRVAFNHQYQHKLCIDGKFDLAKYSTCWLNCRSFNEISPSINLQLLPAHHHQMPALGDNNLFYPHDFGDENNESSGQESDGEVTLSSIGASKPNKLSFQFVAEKASNLVRLAQSDPTTFGSLCNLLDQLTNRLRNSQSIVVQSFDTSLPSRMKKTGVMPLLGTLKAAPNMSTQRPKISRHESRQMIITKTRNPLLSLVGQSNDLAVLAEPRARGKCCSICKCRGHQRGSCPKIHKFKKPPFDMNKDMHSRQELSAALSKSSCYHSEYRLSDDVQEVSTTTPQRTSGIVIHSQFFLSPNITNKRRLECTFLDNLGDAHQTFQNYLFTLECILAYLTRSKSNVVICELEDSRIEGYELFGFSLSQPSLSQPQQNVQYPTPNMQYLSQSKQMGYGIVSRSDQTGYGIASKSDQMGLGLSEPL
jgi:hypothetical protein